MQLFPGLLEQVEVILRQAARVHYHLTQIGDVLLHRVAHFPDWDHVMAVVLIVHARGAYRLRALLTKVLYAFVLMPIAWNY